MNFVSFGLIFLLFISVFLVPHQVIAPRIPGLLERIQQPLYDQNTVATSGTSSLNYFQVPLGSGSISVKSDPAGHSSYIRLYLSSLTLVTSDQEIAIVAPTPWVNMTGSTSSDGTFTMSGQGTVAGYPDILSTMSGSFQNNKLDADLTMGGDGKLPTGQSITYHISGLAQAMSLPSVPQAPQTSSSTTNQENTTPTDQQSTTSTTQVTGNFAIPSWIKNNAKWWAAGEIGDTDMIKGLQYLLSKGIIVIPSATQSSSSSTNIPAWIKNDAEFWSQGSITDSEFVKAIQYLVSIGIITLEPTNTNQSSFKIDTNTVQISIGTSSYATISGKIPNYVRGDPVTISVTRPDNTKYQLSIYAKSTGEFTTPLEFDQTSIQGTYSISVIYGTQILGTIPLDIGRPGYVASIQPEIMTYPIGCAGGTASGVSHDWSWWNTQKAKFTIIENNLTILKQPTNVACGPTVGTIDILHWNSTIAPGIAIGNSTQIIKQMMALMHYKAGWGTTNMTIAAGLSDYINMTGFGGKLTVSVYGREYENGTANTGTGTVHLVHYDVINSTLIHDAMVQKSNVLVIIQSPDGTRSHIMKVLAMNNTKNSDDYYKVALIDTSTGGIITELMDDQGTIGYEDKVWSLVNIITVTPTSK